MPNLTFNLLTFKHPVESYTFYFSNTEEEKLFRIHKSLVPDEVINHFGEQDHYYTSFNVPFEGSHAISKLATLHFPEGIRIQNELGPESAIAQTKEELEKGNLVLFELASLIDDKVAAIDILVKEVEAHNKFKFYEIEFIGDPELI